MVTQARENYTSIQNKQNEKKKLRIRKKTKKKFTFIQFIYIFILTQKVKYTTEWLSDSQ